MARFHFITSGRNKPSAQSSKEPSKKAGKHSKVLGSAPLSIDIPPSRDRLEASSPAASDVKSEIVSPSLPGPQLPNSHANHAVGMAKPNSDWSRDWGVAQSERLDSFQAGVGAASQDLDASSSLKKSRSSSTITSWYDKSKLPLSISQQTSSSAMAKGPPLKAQRTLGTADMPAPARVIQKAASMDFSEFSARPHAPRKPWRMRQGRADGIRVDPIHPSKLSSTPSPAPSPRKIQKRRKNEIRPSVPVAFPRQESISNTMPRPNTAGEIPDLFDHYEQMSLRRVMRQDSMPSIPLHLLELTPEAIGEEPEATELVTSRANSAPVSKRNTGASKSSKRTIKSFEEADLQNTSVLLLSSDSEDEGGGRLSPIADSDWDLSRGQFDPIEDDAGGADDAVHDGDNEKDYVNGLNEVGGAQRGDSRPDSDPSIGLGVFEEPEERARTLGRLGKRTTFAPATTYKSTHGGGKQLPSGPSLRTRVSFNTLTQVAESPTRPESLLSDKSANSAVTSRSKSGCSIQEARAVSMLQANRPANVEIGRGRQRPGVDFSLGVFDGSSEAEAREEMTPPLSPTSVEARRSRSAHTPLARTSGSRRLMAVTRQEEKLLSALRQKQQSIRERSTTGEPIEKGGSRGGSGARRDWESPRRLSNARSSVEESQASSTASDAETKSDLLPEFKMEARSSRSLGRSGQGPVRDGAMFPSPASSGYDHVLTFDRGHSPPTFFASTPESGERFPDLALEETESAQKIGTGGNGLRRTEFGEETESNGLSDGYEWGAAESSLPATTMMTAVEAGGERPCTPQAAMEVEGVDEWRAGVRSMPTSPAELGPGFVFHSPVESAPSEMAEGQFSDSEGDDVFRTDDSSSISPKSFAFTMRKKLGPSLTNTARLSAVGPGPLGGGSSSLSRLEPGWLAE